jgi:hypothetical protein
MGRRPVVTLDGATWLAVSEGNMKGREPSMQGWCLHRPSVGKGATV